QVDDPTPGLRGLDTITTRKRPAAGRTVTAFNPVARPDSQLFIALMSGEHAVHGFANRDLRAKLAATSIRLSDDPKRQSAQASRPYAREPSAQSDPVTPPPRLDVPGRRPAHAGLLDVW